MLAVAQQLCRQEKLHLLRMLNGCKPCLGKISDTNEVDCYSWLLICSLSHAIFLTKYAFMSQLVFECAVGVFVLVRCFVDRKATENAIVDRLGDGFSRPPFATVVVLYYTFCTYLHARLLS